MVFIFGMHLYLRPYSMQMQQGTTNNLHALLGEQWIHDTAWFLGINYVEKEDTAWFGQFPMNNFHPNLYTTHQAILLMQNAGKNVDNAQEIVHWIYSIQQSDGSFDCPADWVDHAPLMLEMYWAVMSLKHLEAIPEHTEKIIDIIVSLQNENGGFSLYPGGNADHQATVLASEILLYLGQNKSEKSLRDAADFLKQQLDIRLQERSGTQAEKVEELKDFLILRTILELTPNHVLPEQYAPVIARAKTLIMERDFIQETLFWPGFSFAHIANQLFDIAEIGVDIGIDIDEINSITLKEVFPRVPEEGTHLFQGIIDPNLLTVNDLIELSKNVGEPYPHVEEIIYKVNRYRIEGGWLALINLHPSFSSTYAALFVAREIGYNQFDLEKVQRFVSNLMENNDASFQERYYALMSFRLLENRLENEFIRNFEESIIKQALQIDDLTYESLLDFTYLARIAKELNIDVPDQLRNKAKVLLESLRMEWKNTPVIRMELLHVVVLVQYIAREEIFPLSELREMLKALWSSQGGFKAATNFPSDFSIEILAEHEDISLPDIPLIQATCTAIQIMTIFPEINILDEDRKKEITKHVLEAKSRYGFDEVSYAMRGKHEKSISLEPTWKSTMAALKILRYISDNQP